MRFDRGQALVPILQGNARVRGQPLGEFVDVGGLPAFMTAHMKWISHQQKRYLPVRHQSGERCHILADIRPLKRGEPLRGNAQGIAQRQSNAFFPQIEGENAPFP